MQMELTPLQRDAVTRLVEEARRNTYGYTPAKITVLRQKLEPLIEAVEQVFPVRRRGLDGKWLPDEEPPAVSHCHYSSPEEPGRICHLAPGHDGPHREWESQP